MLRTLGATALVAAPLIAGSAVLASPAGAVDYHGPDRCMIPYVWRDAGPGDRVCVTTATRTQAAADNAAHAGRVQPGGGLYGPNTCRQGFVWRDAFAGDQVCVTPATRDQAAADNRANPERVVVAWYTPTRFVRSGNVSGVARVDLRPDAIYTMSATVVNTGYPARKVAVACGVPLLNGNVLTLSVAGDVPALSTETTFTRAWRDSRLIANWPGLAADRPATCLIGGTRAGARADVMTTFPGRPEVNLDALEPINPGWV